MTFNECEPWLRLHQHVARKIWYPGVLVAVGLSQNLMSHHPDGTIHIFIPNKDDLSANDWYAPVIDDPGVYCCKCGKRIQHEEPVCVVYHMDDIFKIDIRHKNCEEK